MAGWFLIHTKPGGSREFTQIYNLNFSRRKIIRLFRLLVVVGVCSFVSGMDHLLGASNFCGLDGIQEVSFGKVFGEEAQMKKFLADGTVGGFMSEFRITGPGEYKTRDGRKAKREGL